MNQPPPIRHFRLSDAAFAALAAGRPSRETLAELRRSQISQRLLRLSELLRHGHPQWAATLTREAIEDPMTGLYAAVTLSGSRPDALPTPGEPPTPLPPVSRQLQVNFNNLNLRVRLEDTDPRRKHLGLPPAAALTHAEAARWQHTLTEAWRLLCTRHRPAAELLSEVLAVIVPAEPDRHAGGVSATSAHAYGAVAISEPADPAAFAVGLLHETQHSLLNATHVLFPLLKSRTRMYSPWRADPRPPYGVLHGAYAYLAVTRFWKDETGPIAAFEFARWRAAVVAAVDDLLAREALTPAGVRFAGAMRDEVAPWLDIPVDAEIARLAADANTDHHLKWRLRNLAPGADKDMTAKFDTGGRLPLIHAHLAGRPADGHRPGDLAWLAGRRGEAFAAYGKEIENGDDREETWAGAALTSPFRSLRERPEVIRDRWREKVWPNLAELARRLDGSLM